MSDRVRPFTQDDIPALADMFENVFRQSEKPAEQSLKEYFRMVYFENPWRDKDFPSLVFEADRVIRGFLGVLPIKISHRGNSHWAAVGGNFMVDPSVKNPFAGIQILKNFFGGKQDISMTDTGNEKARKMWEGLGGVTSPAYSMHWIRILRPLRFGMSFFRKGAARLPVKLLGDPIASLVDPLISRGLQTPFKVGPSGMQTRKLSMEGLLDGLKHLAGHGGISPDYDKNSLAWFVHRAEEKKVFGDLKKTAVWENGSMAGWFLYYPNPGAVGQVLQFGSLRKSTGGVLDALLEDAWKSGSTALIGRAEPRDLKEFSLRNCFFFHRSNYFLMHSTNDALIQAIQSGNANLSRLEGDWWTRFQSDKFD